MTTRLAIPAVWATLILGLLLTFGCGGKKEQGNDLYRLVVTYPPQTSSALQVPITAEIPPGFDPAGQDWEVVPAEGAPATAAAAVQFTGRGQLIFLWRPPASDSQTRQTFTLRRREPAQTLFEFDSVSAERLVIRENGSPAIGYVYGMHLADGVPEDRRRASYFHPLWTPAEQVISDDFPEDHYHHRGIFWAWPQVFVGADTLSLWDIRGVKQQFERWLVRETGPVFARLGARNGWYTDSGKRIVDERVWVTVYRGSELGRIMDFELSWEATEEPVGIQGSANIKGYGGFSLRFAPFEEPVITTSGGVQSDDSNRVPFAWADLSARFGGSDEYAGAAIFDHKDNIDFPNGWCLRHYGFSGIAWPGIEPYWLEAGKPLRARYRVWVHSGNAEAGEVSAAYRSWSEPLSAQFTVK